MQRPPQEDFSLKETKPNLGGGTGEKVTSTYGLVEQMDYLYVRVVKAKDLNGKDATASCDPYVEVKLGNYKGVTPHFEKKQNPEWNKVFAFSKDPIQATVLEVNVKDKKSVKDDSIGLVPFVLSEIPKRVPPDSPLAPQWYKLGPGAKGELMLAVWMGTQADEAFPEAWLSDAAAVSGAALANTRSKVYLSPKLYYLRVNVMEAQGLPPSDETCVEAQFRDQVLRTRVPKVNNTTSPTLNNDLMFVAAEPFEESLTLRAVCKKEVLGLCVIPLLQMVRTTDHKSVNPKWFNLGKHVTGEDGKKKEVIFSRVLVRICLEDGYHVFDESAHCSSDLRPTAKQLWGPSIGVLELGILNANELSPMKTMKNGRATTDAYCVAKYGHKWVRTRTIIGSFSPKWNEQYIWEVYDPCTVVTIGVFDNCNLQAGDKSASDSRIGKVRIRLSTLQTDRVYTHSYPLVVLHPLGVKKMGEIHLAMRFTCSSLANMWYMYSQPLLPKMHYIHPLDVGQLDRLRHQATQIVSLRLSRAEPPLRKEVVEYMLDVGSHKWSMRRSKSNFFRIVGVLTGLINVTKWFNQICNWENPFTTVLILILFLILVWYPELILPTVFLYLFLIGVWYYRLREKKPPHMDTRLSCADTAHPDELDEEFDTFPTSRHPDVVRMRYDRLRIIAGRIQAVAGDLATQGERLQSLLSWRDPRATALFMVFCLIAAIVLYVTPFWLVASLTGFYVLRLPMFRHRTPSVILNFFRRLPARTDCML